MAVLHAEQFFVGGGGAFEMGERLRDVAVVTAGAAEIGEQAQGVGVFGAEGAAVGCQRVFQHFAGFAVAAVAVEKAGETAAGAGAGQIIGADGAETNQPGLFEQAAGGGQIAHRLMPFALAAQAQRVFGRAAAELCFGLAAEPAQQRLGGVELQTVGEFAGVGQAGGEIHGGKGKTGWTAVLASQLRYATQAA